MKRIAIGLLVVLSCTPLFGWGEKGHLMVNEAAALGLPADMPVFFHRAYSELTWLGPDPDRWKGNGESIDALNDPDHFIDLEFTSGLNLPRDRFEYMALMESSGRLRQKFLRNDETGFLPWHIAELSEKLTGMFRLWRATKPQSPERAFIERNIIITAGTLGHFIADGSQPLHATSNYNGWLDPNPNGYANDCAIHSRFESTFVSHSIDVAGIVRKLSAPRPVSLDYFGAALSYVAASNAQVEPLYRLDKNGAFATLGAPSPEGVEFTTDRLAAGASMLRDVWWSAWVNSGQARARRSR
jgi:hypothetical protein